MGITNLNRFEEIGLFNAGFGCDRISDMTATLLKKELIIYTQNVCKRHKIKTKKITISQFKFNERFKKWDEKEVELPINPHNKKAVLLVPKKFLRELPTLSAEEFYEFCWSNKNEELRDQYSIEVKGQIKKSEIIEIARQNRDWIAEYESYRDKKGSKPYDIVKDPKGYYTWVLETLEYVKANAFSFTVPSNQDGLYLIGFNLVYSDATNRRCHARIYKNGSEIVATESYANVTGQDPNCTTTFLVPLVAGDYIEIYGYVGSNASVRSQQNETFFWGYKLA